ncbi:BrnA antitoxin family protein [Brevundimonas staleyi]|uniref:BrnA antitoxin family protein n=1 Tax=Brevundimonas staleyi TaxID=74326 RepID=A0ABW0FXR6_9CAUL
MTDPDNPEWTEADFERAVGPESLPPEVLAAFPRTKVRGAQAAPTKTPISLRVDADVLERYRATGPGWQGRMNAVLRKGVAGL